MADKTTRHYVVESKAGKRLVKAGNGAQAVRHVVRNEYKVHRASHDELVELVANGTKPELAGASED